MVIAPTSSKRDKRPLQKEGHDRIDGDSNWGANPMDLQQLKGRKAASSQGMTLSSECLDASAVGRVQQSSQASGGALLPRFRSTQKGIKGPIYRTTWTLTYSLLDLFWNFHRNNFLVEQNHLQKTASRASFRRCLWRLLVCFERKDMNRYVGTYHLEAAEPQTRPDLVCQLIFPRWPDRLAWYGCGIFNGPCPFNLICVTQYPSDRPEHSSFRRIAG